MTTATDDTAAPAAPVVVVGIPQCQYRETLKMFQVMVQKGKVFSNGGFGIALPKGLHDATTGENNLYVFPEEALFLHLAGLAEFYSSTENESIALDTSQLQKLLTLDWAVFSAYSHLRRQEFRVLRYNPFPNKNLYHTPAPTLSSTIAWNVYLPNSSFSKTKPGVPDFGVVVCHYSGSDDLDYTSLQSLLEKSDTKIKVAAVSDSGTVVLFGVTNEGVPTLYKNTHASRHDESIIPDATETDSTQENITGDVSNNERLAP